MSRVEALCAELLATRKLSEEAVDELLREFDATEFEVSHGELLTSLVRRGRVRKVQGAAAEALRCLLKTAECGGDRDAIRRLLLSAVESLVFLVECADNAAATSASAALCNMSVGNTMGKQRIVQAGGLKGLLRNVQNVQKRRTLACQEACAACLANLATGQPETRSAIVIMGGIPVFVDVLEEAASSEVLKAHSAHALWSLAYSPANKVNIVNAGALRHLLPLLSEPRARESASGLLSSLLFHNRDNKEALLRLNSCPALVGLAADPSANSGTLENVTATLRSLAVLPAARAALATEGVTETLVRLLTEDDDSEGEDEEDDRQGGRVSELTRREAMATLRLVGEHAKMKEMGFSLDEESSDESDEEGGEESGETQGQTETETAETEEQEATEKDQVTQVEETNTTETEEQEATEKDQVTQVEETNTTETEEQETTEKEQVTEVEETNATETEEQEATEKDQVTQVEETNTTETEEQETTEKEQVTEVEETSATEKEQKTETDTEADQVRDTEERGGDEREEKKEQRDEGESELRETETEESTEEQEVREKEEEKEDMSEKEDQREEMEVERESEEREECAKEEEERKEESEREEEREEEKEEKEESVSEKEEETIERTERTDEREQNEKYDSEMEMECGEETEEEKGEMEMCGGVDTDEEGLLSEDEYTAV